MGMDPQLGDIAVYPYNFVPRNWAECNGQLLPIAQNTALFSLLGTTYGGDGRSTFALPDLQGRLAVHAGRGPGLAARRLGERGGVETVPLTVDQMGSHNHAAVVVNGPPDSTAPSTSVAASNGQGRGSAIYSGAAGTGPLEGLVDAPGRSTPHTNLMPTLTLLVCISLAGTYPSRS